MSIPTYDQFIEPLLRYLAVQTEAVSAAQAAEGAALALGLTEEEKQVLLPSGLQVVYRNRAGWAHDRLKRAGLSSSVKRGFWALTEKGRDFVRQHPQPLKEEEVQQLAPAYRAEPRAGRSSEKQEVDSEAAWQQSPDERLEGALQDIRGAVELEILERLASVTPAYFEVVVLDLLFKMGYGNSRIDLQRVGGSGDGGIDGVIPLDKLGLEKVYVQAKRWQGTVGRPELQAFYGALAGQKAKKGVFITTSGYTNQALEFSKSVDGLVLIDGPRLASLMVDYEVGVSAKTLRLPKIDGDYFDEGSV